MGSVTPKQGEGRKGGGGEGGAEHRLLGSVCVWGARVAALALILTLTLRPLKGWRVPGCIRNNQNAHTPHTQPQFECGLNSNERK